MTSNYDPVFSVLNKLRDAVISGKSLTNLNWEYDFGTSYQVEDTALKLLETRGVISTLAGDSLLKVKSEGHIEYEGSTSPSDIKNWKRYVTGVDMRAYEKVCSEYGLEPYSKTYAAELELKDETVPMVSVGGVTYKLPALHSGKATDIIVHAYKHKGRSIPASELRDVVGMKQLPNIKDTLRAGLFSPGALLSPFATASTHSITLTDAVQLDEKQFARISSHLIA